MIECQVTLFEQENVAFNTIWLMNFNSLVSIDDST